MEKQCTFLKNGIAQVALVVKDLDQTVKNFYELFGIGPWSFYTYKKPFVPQMRLHGVEADYSMRVALANIGPMRIELIEQLEGETVYKEFIDKHGYGIHHLGIAVNDIHSAIDEASRAGLTIPMEGAGFGENQDGHYAYIETEPLIGTTLELIERPKTKKAPEKIFPEPLV